MTGTPSVNVSVSREPRLILTIKSKLRRLLKASWPSSQEFTSYFPVGNEAAMLGTFKVSVFRVY